VAVMTDHFFIPQFPFGVLEWSLLSIALISAIGYSSFVFLIVTTGPVFASQVGFMVTITGVLWGIIIFQDEYSGTVWLALIIMMAGLALVTPRKDKTPAPPLPPSGVKPFPSPKE
jgi:drug/metabolite transporter (DMT)-like permease